MATGKGSGARGNKPSPTGKGQQSRQERVNELRAAEAKRERKHAMIIVAVGVICVALVIGLVAFFYLNRPKPAAAPRGVTDYRVAGATDNWGGIAHTHKEGDLTYPQSPPVGGDHDPVWQNCGVYNAPIRNENGVHSLEHGSVWITYQPTLPAAQLATIKKDVRGLDFTLVSPYPGDPSPVVASAWGAQLKLDSAKDSRLKQFIAFYRLNPHRTPEFGASCSGGTGAPTG